MPRRSVLAVLGAALLVAACSSSPSQPRFEIFVESDSRGVIDSFVSYVPDSQITVTPTADPVASLAGTDDLPHIAIVTDGACEECYRLERTEAGYVVHGGAPLGIQYGLAHMLELFGYRFFSPFYTEVPGRPAVPADDDFGIEMAPEKSRRGLHLHTIHPIEAYYAYWETGEDRLDDALRIADWVIKNRGNYVQWVALDNIQSDAGVAEAWHTHTAAILEGLRARGLKTGLAIQLFGQSNLQQGFDLIDSEDGSIPPRTEIESRLPVILDGLPFDNINISFGEFFGADPQDFVDTLDLSYTILQEQAPGTEMAATIHVGNTDDLRVDYMNENILYYFLVKFANPAIEPWIHTVMYYNLFEDAGGAYHHDEFDEHRAYLLERLQADQPIGYFPETAYWVAFDNSVPVYLPLYVRSRWLDLDQIRAEANTLGASDLDDHVLFSSGWEWGYWQNDYAALRASYTLAPTWEAYFEQMFAPFGAAGAEAANQVIELTKVQHEYMLVKRLAAYFAGRDLYIDVGREIDILSQPDRPLFEEVLAMSAEDRAQLVADVLVPLEEADTKMRAIRAVIEGLDLDHNLRWYRELVDGVAVTTERSAYIHALFSAVVAYAESGTDDGWLAKAETALANAHEIVARRHADLHYPHPDELTYGTTNATYYQWGYLKQTHELCYWERERIEVARAIEGSTEVIPSCVF